MITDYTTYDDIRAALGVSTDDLEDSTLALKLYSDYLQGELDDVSEDVASTFATVKALSTPTAIETRFLTACSLFCTFALARQLTAALPLFAAKDVTDGKAAVGRFDSPFKEVIKSVNDQYGKQRTRLIAALSTINSTSKSSASLVYVGVSSPSYDPVTGT